MGRARTRYGVAEDPLHNEVPFWESDFGPEDDDYTQKREASGDESAELKTFVSCRMEVFARAGTEQHRITGLNQQLSRPGPPI